MIEQFLSANLAITTIAEGIASSDAEIVLAAGAGALFPSLVPDQYFVATLSNASGTLVEIVKVTSRSGDVVTATRGQEGTSAQEWPAGSLFAQRWTAAQAQAVVQKTMLRPTLLLEFEDGLVDVEIDLSEYNFNSAGVLVRMMATEAKNLVDITGLDVSIPVTLYVEEDSEAIGIELGVPPFFLSNIYGNYGWPGLPRTTISFLCIPENSQFTFIETSRTTRIS